MQYELRLSSLGITVRGKGVRQGGKHHQLLSLQMSLFPEPPILLTEARGLRGLSFPPLSSAAGGRWTGSDCVLSLFLKDDKAVLARIPSPSSSWPLLAGEEEEEEPQKESDTICSKATWDCSSVTKLKAMPKSLSFLSCSKATASPRGPDRLQRHQSV